MLRAVQINYAARIGGVMRGHTKEEAEVLEYVVEPFPNAYRIHRSRLQGASASPSASASLADHTTAL